MGPPLSTLVNPSRHAATTATTLTKAESLTRPPGPAGVVAVAVRHEAKVVAKRLPEIFRPALQAVAVTPPETTAVRPTRLQPPATRTPRVPGQLPRTADGARSSYLAGAITLPVSHPSPLASNDGGPRARRGPSLASQTSRVARVPTAAAPVITTAKLRTAERHRHRTVVRARHGAPHT